MNKKGISLIEMMISLCISAVIMAGAYQSFIHQAKNYETQEVLAEAQNDVRSGLLIMTDDLRMAGFDREGNGSNVVVANAIAIHNPDTIRVEWELDNNTVKAVQYYLADGKLKRNIFMNDVLVGPSQEVLDNLTSLAFSYESNGSKILRTNVELTVKNRALTSAISFRNMK
jgi:type IV pilus assembly protein PilW